MEQNHDCCLEHAGTEMVLIKIKGIAQGSVQQQLVLSISSQVNFLIPFTVV